MMYNLDEVFLVPAPISKVEHRDDCNIYYDNKLPLFISPMTSLVDIDNRQTFEDIGFNTILPRTIDFDTRVEMMREGKIVAFGLKEVEHLYTRFSYMKLNGELNYVPKICIDQANGHMSKLLDICSKLKELLGHEGIWIMTGNIANQQTYYEYAKIGIDAVRLGIGSGNVCFPAGTKIKINNEEKNIEDIKIGDKVLTLDGEKKVKNIFTKTTNELITINNDIQCTPNHKFLVINKNDKSLVNEDNLKEYSFYIEAQNLTQDYLLVQA